VVGCDEEVRSGSKQMAQLDELIFTVDKMKDGRLKMRGDISSLQN
jgi:hypothetical protein